MDEQTKPELREDEVLAFAAKLARFRGELPAGELVVFDRVVWAAARQRSDEVVGFDDGGYDPLAFLIRAFTGTAGAGRSYPYANVPADWPNAQSPALLPLDDDPILQ